MAEFEAEVVLALVQSPATGDPHQSRLGIVDEIDKYRGPETAPIVWHVASVIAFRREQADALGLRGTVG